MSCASDLAVETRDGLMPVRVARPDGPPRGGVLILHAAFGVSPFIERICDRLAAANWLAAAPALFHRTDTRVVAYDDVPAARAAMGGLSAAGMEGDVDAVLELLAAERVAARQTGVVGYWAGCGLTLATAARVALGAAVTFGSSGLTVARHGLPALVDVAASLRTPWLGCFGAEDVTSPEADIDRLADAAAAAVVSTEVVSYAGAGHGYTNDDQPGSYHRPSAEQSWQRAAAWLDTYLTPAPGRR